MLENIRAWIKLLSAPDIGSAKALRLVKNLGEPIEFLEKQNSPLEDISFISTPARDYLQSSKDPENWQKVAGIIEKFHINFTTILDDNYPYILKKIPDPPIWLFYRGELKESDFTRSLGVVGTRKPSNYGKVQCQKIVSELVEQKITIISGLAYGIDAIAHSTTVRQKGRTIAVLGTGVEQIYPPGNRQLAEKILGNGVILSEYLPGSKINLWNFPTRNRLISGISQGTFVVEGGKKSGAMITARYAREQQRTVFTLPADINRESSAGSNLLLQKGGYAVLKSDDILNTLGFSTVNKENPIAKLDNLNEFELKIYNILLDVDEEIDFDRLLLMTKMQVSKLSSLLLSLELKGYLKKTAGNRIYVIR